MEALVKKLFHRPLRGQLMLLVMSITGTAIFLLCLAFTANDLKHIKQNLTHELNIVNNIIGKRLVYSLNFNQPQKAAQDLEDLEQKPSILLGCVYDASGTLFASYSNTPSHNCPTQRSLEEARSFSLNNTTVTNVLKSKAGETVGYFFILSDLRDIYNQLATYLVTTLIIIALIVALTYFLASRMRRLITRRIYDLTTVTHAVREGDYSARTKVTEKFDEIGELSEAFNFMLHEVDDLKNNLEQKVAEQTRDLKKALREAKRARKAAEKANALKSEWIRNIGHEIRTPIHGILSFARFGEEDLSEQQVNKDDLEDYFSKITSSANRLCKLIEGLLEFGKLEAGKMEFELTEGHFFDVIEQVTHELEAKAKEKNVTLKINAPDFSTEGVFDEQAIGQVMINITGNALKFSPDGGEIEFNIAPDTITINGREKKAYKVTVKDEGVGIPDDELEDIFNTFAQSSNTKTGAGGTGLGLSITRKIIEAHGGNIWAENNADKGASFIFTIPAKCVINQ